MKKYACSLDFNDKVYHEVLPQDRRINKEYNLRILRSLGKAIRLGCPHSWRKNNYTTINFWYFVAYSQIFGLKEHRIDAQASILTGQSEFSKLKRTWTSSRFLSINEIKSAKRYPKDRVPEILNAWYQMKTTLMYRNKLTIHYEKRKLSVFFEHTSYMQFP